MRNDLRSSIIWLGPNQLLELREAQGRVLTSVIGTLWMTQEGDPRDVVIRAGEAQRIERAGVTLVQTLHGAAYVLIEDGVEARVIHADGSSETVAHATVVDASAGVPGLPSSWSATQLHARAREERARAIATLFADTTDAMLDGLRRAGRRLATLMPAAAATLAR
jgi:hypothetical protein